MGPRITKDFKLLQISSLIKVALIKIIRIRSFRRFTKHIHVFAYFTLFISIDVLTVYRWRFPQICSAEILLVVRFSNNQSINQSIDEFNFDTDRKSTRISRLQDLCKL